MTVVGPAGHQEFRVLFLVSWPGGSWQATAKDVVTVLAAYIAVLWVAMIFWTYRDIRNRTRDPIVQASAILCVVLLFLPGYWIYLILRPRYTLNDLYERSLEEEALLQELEDQKICPGCKRRVRDDYIICPSCRAHLKEPCAKCERPLNYSWSACPYCGTTKAPREGLGARPVHVAASPSARPSMPRRTASPATSTSSTSPRPRLGSTLRRPVSAEEDPIIDSTVD